ncbi:KCNB1-like protein [Mya arenaria]|uniref:KCNB1-like protein n=1 Tax=Mya arenaria TaxID=6604 RepID=A0ABY7F213_MYAAR|nr:KCNB1-like protein [Mya arenaria]WAR15121.1 KCNB1-like protein [Mya arenaria]
MERITANVSGVRFEFSGNILENYPDHNLMIMYAKKRETDIKCELIIDRPADCFAAILAFYQTGELHIPTAVCPSAFRRELEFWKISASYMPTCCAYRETSQVEPLLSEKKSRWTTLRGRVWSIIDYKVPSIAAKLYMALIFLMVLLCVFTQALSTMPEFQRALTKCEYLKYLEEIEHTHVGKARRKLGDPDCDGSSFFDEGDINPLSDEDHEWTQTYWDSKENLSTSTCNTGTLMFLNYFQIFRTLRMIRLVSNLRASRVLVFSIRQNIKDMMLLGLLLTVAVSVTGHLIYFMEDPETIGSVPNAWYWAVITLTTVGYGDISPVTCLGKILASLMAISGVLLLAVTVPTFVNNFLTLYQYACLDDYIGSKLSAEQGPEQINSQVAWPADSAN